MQVPKVHSVIISVIRELGAVGKDGKNKDQNYDYRRAEDVYNALHPLFGKCGLYIHVDSVSETFQQIESQRGAKGFHTRVKVSYKVCADDGSFIEVRSIGESIDYGDKSFNKAMTASFKYMLTQLFIIPTKDIEDSDAGLDEPKQETKKLSTIAMPPVPPNFNDHDDFANPKFAPSFDVPRRVPVSKAVELHEIVKSVGMSIPQVKDAIKKATGKEKSSDCTEDELDNVIKFIKLKA